MTPLEQWTLWCWFAFWLVWLAAWLYTKPTKWQQSTSDRLSYGLLLWLAFVLVLLSFTHNNFLGVDIKILPRPGGVVWLGFLMTLIGVLFAIWARAILGRNWSRSMDLKQGHELIISGPYALVRHPIYTGLILMYVGSTLVLGTLFPLIACVLAIWSCLIRIPAEETLMTHTFPEAYPAYARRVKRLVPFIF